MFNDYRTNFYKTEAVFPNV